MSLAFQCKDVIHGGDSLPLGVLGVGDGFADDVLKEYFQNTTGFFIDETRDTLDTTTTCQTADGRLGDSMRVITMPLPVMLGTTLSESLSSFAYSIHCYKCSKSCKYNHTENINLTLGSHWTP